MSANKINFDSLKARLRVDKKITIELVSNSMSPILPTGALAEIEPVAYDEIAPLDFIVFQSQQKLICHTVWGRGFFKSARGERTLVTRGLNNPFFDYPVSESDVLGRVTSHRISRFKFYLLAIKFRMLGRLAAGQSKQDPEFRF